MTEKRQRDFSCAMEASLSVISGKWKLKILNRLLKGTKRYSDVKRSLPGITEKMLTQQLRELEDDQIITRKVYPVVPPRVEYTCTPLGEQLTQIFKALEIWGSHFLTETNPDGTLIQNDQSCYQIAPEPQIAALKQKLEVE